MNLQGLELVKYVQDCVDRDERAKKREAERQEREAERLEREAERASREKIEFVKLKLEQNGGLDTARDTSHSVPRNNPRLPICKENTDSIDSFLFRFESHATALKWPRSDWPVLLSASLEGQALSLYHGLSANGLVDYDYEYDTLKKKLLTKFQCSADGFRERCRPNESFQSFGERMRHLFERWVEMSEINKTYEDVFDLILAEQFLQSPRT